MFACGLTEDHGGEPTFTEETLTSICKTKTTCFGNDN